MKQFVISLFFFLIIFDKAIAQSFCFAQATGINNNAQFSALAIDKNNNIYLTGWFNGTVDFNFGTGVSNLTAVGNFNMFLLKEDASGNFIWVKHFPGLSSNVSKTICRAINIDSQQNIYLAGGFIDSFDFDPGPGVFPMSSHSAAHAFIEKLDSNGNFIWAKHFGGIGLNNWAEIGDFKLNKSLHELYLLCSIGGSLDADPGPNTYTIVNSNTLGNDILVEKLDTAGNFIWAKQIKGTNDHDAFTLGIDSNDNLYFAGKFKDSIDFDPSSNYVSAFANNNYDIFVEKLDSSGNYVWAKSFPEPVYNDEGGGITVDKSNNVLFTGHFGGTIDFDPGPAIHALSANLTSAFFLLKLNTNGNYVWANTIGAEGGGSVITDSLCNVYTVGVTSGGDVDPGPSVYTLYSQGSKDVFVQKLDSFGNFIFAVEFGTSGYDYASAIKFDNVNNILLCGNLGAYNSPGSGDLDPGLGIFNVFGNNYGFLEKLCVTPPPLNITVLNDTICVGDIAVLSVESIQGATYIWGKDGSPLNNSNNDTLLVTQPGDYTVNVYGVGCPYSSDTVHVSVFPVITPTIQITSFPFSVPAGQQVTVHATVGATGGYPYTIYWYNHGVLFATTTTDVVTYVKPIGKDSLSAVIKVNTPCTSPVTSNLIFVTGIGNRLAQDNFSISPNPASAKVYIQSQRLGNLEITDVMGRVVLQQPIVNTQTSVDLNSLSDGLYIYRFFANDGTLIQDKLLLMR